MRFAILTQLYPPEVGAQPTRISHLAERASQRGHAVTVLTAMPNYPTGKIYPGYGGLLKREQVGAVKIIRTAIFPTQKAGLVPRLANYFSFVFSSAALGTLLLRRPDYLFVQSPPLFLGLSGFWLSRVKRTRLVFNVSDLWPESGVSLGMLREGSLLHRLSARLEAFYYRHAWLITGQSQTILANITERFPGCPTFGLFNGVDTQRFHPGQRTAAARATLGGNDKCVALYVGLHGLAQGLGQVLDAAKQLSAERVCRFVFVGDGPEKQDLQEQARALGLDDVLFLDPRPIEEIPALLAAADVILVPLKSYIPGAVPSKLYEAMASGRALVLSAGGEAADIVKTHRAGLVVEPGDAEALAQAVRTLCESPALREELGANGRQAAERHFDRTVAVDRFLDYLEANATQKRGGRQTAA